VGLVTNNRPLCEDGDKIVGCFLNTVPVRIKIPADLKFSDYIRMIDQKLVELKKFDRTSLFEIMKIIGEKSHEGNPIFDDNFNYIDFHVYQDLEQFPIEEASRKYLGLGFEKTNTMFDLRIDALVGNFMMFLHYSPVLVSEENANKLCGYFIKVLKRYVEAPESIMGKDMLLDDHEKQRLLRVFNSTHSQYPEEETIQTLFEAQVQKTPDHTAVRFADHLLSYRQLNRKANRLAGTLQRQGVQPGTIVALMLERSLELVTGMLAVLKAGGAYLPIDVDYPEERKRLILQDSGARLLGSKEALIRQYEEALTMFSLESVIALDSDGAYSENPVNPASPNRPNDPAYIIYTSGTTGIPKGVMIEHRGLVNYAWWAAAVYVRGERVNFPLYTSISFDLTVTSIYTPLITGNGIVGYGGEGKEFLIERLFSENDVDVVKLTPSH
jgi:non-ribosomal peptide synthetase component F